VASYGRCGLIWSGETARSPTFVCSCENIQTYTEQQFSRTIKEDIESALVGARIVIFLGFGFHQQNMNILKSADRRGAKHAIATALNIDAENDENLRTWIQTDLTCTNRPQLLRRSAKELLVTMKSTILNPRT